MVRQEGSDDGFLRLYGATLFTPGWRTRDDFVLLDPSVGADPLALSSLGCRASGQQKRSRPMHCTTRS